MLNVFPTLLDFGIFAPFFLRLVVGVFFLYLGYLHLSKERLSIASEIQTTVGAVGTLAVWLIGGAEILIGGLFVAGFLTQIAALLGMVVTLKMLAFRKKFVTLAKYHAPVYILMFVICLSLLLTGAGGLAFDIPL